ncbi:50S ribosomal protein L35 [Lyticum sinuosum]|uniref:Large ribosomal subunit protein bL35 n=1 Tax=Lyticum sinuosum TaxID=1332059 RepID=A0AAE4VKD6_9RICK|nr:50S ribosomal protein L35 [Lyticum sinuosum]
MPKLKTKSGAKKRFKVLASGKIKSTQANKRHNMRKLGNRQLRTLRGTTILDQVETRRVRAYFPYNSKRRKPKQVISFTDEQIREFSELGEKILSQIENIN